MNFQRSELNEDVIKWFGPSDEFMSSRLRLPTTRRALTVVVKALGSQRSTYDAHLTELPLLTPKPGEVVVRIEAVGFNHRDVSFVHQTRILEVQR